MNNKINNIVKFLLEKREFLLKRFLLGGLIFIIYTIIIYYGFPHVAGFLSGAVPIVFSFTIMSVFLHEGRNVAMETAILAIKGIFLWIVYALIIYISLKNKYSLLVAFILAIIAWGIGTYYIMKKKIL